MDFEDINPVAFMLGLGGAGITLFMMKFGGTGIPLFWKVLTPIATFFVCFFMVQKMTE